MIQNQSPQAALWRHPFVSCKPRGGGPAVCHNQTTSPRPNSQPKKRIRGPGFFRWSTSFSTNIFSAISLSPKKLTVVGGKWLALLKWNSKDWNENTRKNAVPSHYGFLCEKRGGKGAAVWWLGTNWRLRSHRKVDEANGYGSCGFGMLCRKSVVGLGWGIRSEKRIMLVEMCFNFHLVKKIRNELEYLFGGKFWIFLGNRRRKRVLNKSWRLPQKKATHMKRIWT